MATQLTFRLRGGIGNQLFIIAAAIEFSITHSTPIMFSEDEMKHYKKRRSHLVNLGLVSNTLYLPHLEEDSINFKKISGSVHISTRTVNYWGLKYTKLLITDDQANVELNGYFQSPKFFESIFPNFLNYLRNHFVRHASVSPQAVYQIRLGDLARNSNIKKIHGFCEDSYWLETSRMLTLPTHSQIVITDDRKGIEIFLPEFYRYIAKNKIQISQESDFEDLNILATSVERVISNSTFGWWGSHLAIGGKTIAPEKWYKDDRLLSASRDLLNPNWLYI